jgi:hypothetical protein
MKMGRVVVFVVMVISVVMQSNTVELFERIRQFSHGCSKTRVQRDALDPPGSNINTLGLLNIPEVGCFDTLALVGDDRWLHVP